MLQFIFANHDIDRDMLLFHEQTSPDRCSLTTVHYFSTTPLASRAVLCFLGVAQV